MQAVEEALKAAEKNSARISFPVLDAGVVLLSAVIDGFLQKLKYFYRT